MNNLQQLEFLKNHFNLDKLEGSIPEMILNIVLLMVMTSVLAWVYTRVAQTLSNRQRLARVFPLLSLTTMMMIAVIKSSLALSLGLVGALSIVRFRAAIKEPEELAYIFLAIALGLGMGSNQQELTIIFFILLLIFIGLKTLLEGKFSQLLVVKDQSLYLDLVFKKKKVELKNVVQVLEKYCHFIELKRMDYENSAGVQLLFLVKTADYKQLDQLKTELLELDQKVKINLLQDERLFS